MPRPLLLLAAAVLGALFGATWVWLDAGNRTDLLVKTMLWSGTPLALLAGIRRLTQPTSTFDALWILLYALGAFVGLVATAIAVGMGGMR